MIDSVHDENDYCVVNYRLVALLIACLYAISASTNVRGQQGGEKSLNSEFVRVTGEAIGLQQCIRPIDETRRQVQSTLQFRLRLTNVSSQPLIIYRYDPAVFDSRLSRTLAGIQDAQFQFAERPPFRCCVSPRSFEEIEPTNEFRVLQPKESFTYESPESLTFLATESVDSGSKRFEGDYFLQLKAATWIWEVEKAEKLQQRWTRLGNFFYNDVTSEPFPITITKPGATIARCDTLSVK